MLCIAFDLCVIICHLYCHCHLFAFTILVIEEEFKKNAVTLRKCKTNCTTHVKISAAHNKCTARRYTHGSMRFETQLLPAVLLLNANNVVVCSLFWRYLCKPLLFNPNSVFYEHLNKKKLFNSFAQQARRIQCMNKNILQN